jgi:hypothetical protein
MFTDAKSFGITFLAVGLIGFGGEPPDDPLPRGLETPMQGEECPVCEDNCLGIPDWHENELATPFIGNLGLEHSCAPGACTFIDHPLLICNCPPEVCGSLQSHLDIIRTGLIEHDSDGISGLLHRYPRAVSYNAARQAVQIRGCTGSIVGHFPLPDDMTRMLRLTD